MQHAGLDLRNPSDVELPNSCTARERSIIIITIFIYIFGSIHADRFDAVRNVHLRQMSAAFERIDLDRAHSPQVDRLHPRAAGKCVVGDHTNPFGQRQCPYA